MIDLFSSPKAKPMLSVQILETIKALSFVEKVTLIEFLSKEVKAEVLKTTALPNRDNQIEESTDLRSENYDDADRKREKAAELLFNDYLTNEELTAFSVLDSEDFYEYETK